jgi:hypothetical protein
MITDSFDRRTLANMEVALDRACSILPTGREKHRARKIIARKIIECAQRGDNTLGGLSAAGYSAVSQLCETRDCRDRRRPRSIRTPPVHSRSSRISSM